MEPRERLKILRQTLNANQAFFAKGLLISTSYYAGIETGKKQINQRILDMLTKVYNANQEWILTGNGEMFKNEPPDMKLEELISIYKRLNSYFQGYLLNQAKTLDKIQEKEPKKR